MTNKESVKILSAALFAALSVVLMIFLLCMANSSFLKISDLPEFYGAARQVLSGRGSDVYVLEQQGASYQALFPGFSDRVLGFFVNPFALPFIVPIGWVPVEYVRPVWKGLLLLALGASIYLMRKCFELDLRGTLWLIAVTLSSCAAYEALRIDQISSFMLCGLMLAVWAILKDRPVIAALGLSVLLLKPQELLPLVVFLLGARKYKIVLYLAVIGAILAGIGFAEVGLTGLLNYKSLMVSTATNSSFLQTDLSPTLRGQLFRLFPAAKGTLTAVTSVVFLATLMFIYYLGHRFKDSFKWLQAALLCAIPLGFAASPYFFDYDLLLLMPPLVVLMKEPLQDKIPQWALLIGMLGGLCFSIPIAVQIHYEYLLKGGPINPFFWMLLLFSIGLVMFTLKNREYFNESV